MDDYNTLNLYSILNKWMKENVFLLLSSWLSTSSISTNDKLLVSICLIIQPSIYLSISSSIRHQEASNRTSFTSMFQYLSQPKEQLLEHELSEEEKQKSPNGTILGRLLEAGDDLFKNLQTRYLE